MLREMIHDVGRQVPIPQLPSVDLSVEAPQVQHVASVINISKDSYELMPCHCVMCADTGFQGFSACAWCTRQGAQPSELQCDAGLQQGTPDVATCHAHNGDAVVPQVQPFGTVVQDVDLVPLFHGREPCYDEAYFQQLHGKRTLRPYRSHLAQVWSEPQ